MKNIALHQSLGHILVSQSPLHAYYKAFVQAEDEYTDATDTGQLCHSLLLGGKEVVSAEFDDWRTKAAREMRDDCRANGKIPVLAHKLRTAEILVAKVTEELRVRGIELAGVSEINLRWESPGGVQCAGRLDHFIAKGGKIYDLKFCQSASPQYISKAMYSYGYDIQFAAYTQAVEFNYPPLVGRTSFTFIFIEAEAPHAITLARPAGDMRALGNWRWSRACELWADCLEKYGTETPWPAYGNEIVDVYPPAWALNEEVIKDEILDGGNL